MGIRRFMRSLNCFGNSKRREKSSKQVKKELSRMHATISVMEEKIETTKQIIEGCRKKQQLAEEREKAMRDKRGRLMERVQCVENELNLALKHRQVTLAEIIKTGLRKMALEKDLQAMEKKATFFWVELHYSDPNPRKTMELWRENLRQLRSQNDVHKAVLQPPLCPVNEEVIFWEYQQEFSCDDVRDTVYQDNGPIMATYV
ncbi:hypothetical protein ABFA07_021734 [Porites harrisoni]